MAFAKASLLHSYRRLSKSRWLDLAFLITNTVIAAYSIAFVVILVCACIPGASKWAITATEQQGIAKGVVYVAVAAADVVTSLVLLILPVPAIWRLQLPKTQKLGLACMFFIGVVTLAISCFQLALIPSLVGDSDITWAVSTSSILISAETSLIIICACFPTLLPFLRHYKPSWVGGSNTAESHPEAVPIANIAIEPTMKSRTRPISELTIFKGRPTRLQAWERMPDVESVRSPVTVASLDKFDSDLPKMDSIMTPPSENRLGSPQEFSWLNLRKSMG